MQIRFGLNIGYWLDGNWESFAGGCDLPLCSAFALQSLNFVIDLFFDVDILRKFQAVLLFVIFEFSLIDFVVCDVKVFDIFPSWFGFFSRLVEVIELYHIWINSLYSFDDCVCFFFLVSLVSRNFQFIGFLGNIFSFDEEFWVIDGLVLMEEVIHMIIHRSILKIFIVVF